MVLNLKGIEYEMKTVNLIKQEHLSAEHKALNPNGTVPLLLRTSSDGSIFKIGQSLAAIEYLDESLPKAISFCRRFQIQRQGLSPAHWLTSLPATCSQSQT